MGWVGGLHVPRFLGSRVQGTGACPYDISGTRRLLSLAHKLTEVHRTLAGRWPPRRTDNGAGAAKARRRFAAGRRYPNLPGRWQLSGGARKRRTDPIGDRQDVSAGEMSLFSTLSPISAMCTQEAASTIGRLLPGNETAPNPVGNRLPRPPPGWPLPAGLRFRPAARTPIAKDAEDPGPTCVGGSVCDGCISDMARQNHERASSYAT